MANGELTGLYQDMPLTNLAARRKRAGLVAPRILASLSVNKPTGNIYVLDPEQTALLVQDTVRAISGEAKSLYGSKPTLIPYEVRDHSLTDVLADELRIADTVLADDLDSVQNIMDKLDLEREVRLPAQIKAALIAAGYTATPSEKFNAASPSADPITYLNTQIGLFIAQCGVRPNLMVMDYTVAQVLVNHPKFLERAKYTMPPASLTTGIEATERLLAAIFTIQEVVIAEGHVYNNVNKGGTVNLTNIWADDILLAYKEPASTRYAGLGLEMLFNGFINTQGSGGVKTVVNGYVIEKARNARRYADEFFVHRWYTDKLINTNAGRIITDVLS